MSKFLHDDDAATADDHDRAMTILRHIFFKNSRAKNYL